MIVKTDAGQMGGLMDASPMSRAQISVLCIAVLLSMLDGFDLLGMAFVAPALTKEWGLDKATLGFLLSTSLIGMAIGSLILSPFGDVVGRKPMVLGSIVLMIVGSLLSALCHTVPQLAACRILTGVGMGTLIPLGTTIASEFASLRYRPLAIAATTIGLPAGSIVGGLIASILLEHVGWTSVFVSGAVAGALLLPFVAWGLPESPAFLIARRPKGALERLNRVLSRLGRPIVADMPVAPSGKRPAYRDLFAHELIGTTLRFVAIQILVSTTAYYLINWLPQLVSDLGFPPSTGSLASAVSSVVGMVSGLTFGAIAARVGPAGLAAAGMIGFGLAIAAFGLVPPVFGLVLLAAAACGFFLNGCTGIFYATVASGFPASSRVSGIGFVMGIGRVFSVAGPSMAGWMFASGLGRAEVSLIFGCAPILAGILLFSSGPRRNLPTTPAGVIA